jgi:hypothetical protein
MNAVNRIGTSVKHNLKLQSAIEMLSVYSWAIILIAMVVALVFVLNGPFAPAQYLSSSCNIQPLMLCMHTYLAPYTKSGNPIKFTLIFVNNMGVTLNFTNQPFNVTTTNVGSVGTLNSTGTCAPSIAHASSEVICTANIYGTVEPPMYSSTSTSFKIGYTICKGSTCSGPYVSTGTSIQQLSPGAEDLVNLSVIANPSNGAVVINGIKYSSGIVIPLEKENYVIYAVPPRGYSFSNWIIKSQTSNIINANSIQATLVLNSSATLTANFIKS